MKRNLFKEISEGFNALKANREAKLTLKQHEVEKKISQEYGYGY